LSDTGVYVHVPFCRKRCPYCAFVLIESDGSLHDRFTDKICGQIRASAPAARTLYFGGGTPSMLGAAAIGRMVGAVGGRPEEVTVECNPEGLALDGLRAAGVTRITLGIQALDDALLKTLGREHDADGARKAWHTAAAEFDNICVDLIFGVPGQSRDGWRRTLDEVRSWSPAHVSLYGLTYERGTPFEKRRDRLPEELEKGMYEDAMDRPGSNRATTAPTGRAVRIGALVRGRTASRGWSGGGTSRTSASGSTATTRLRGGRR
jgi:oxygen-independent coproporphyrinogen-3 oxidase